MANGWGGRRPGAGRPKGSTKRVRYLGPVLAAEQSIFRLLPLAEDTLRRAMELGDVQAAALVLKYALVPAEKRQDVIDALAQVRLVDDPEDDDGGE